MEFTHATSPIPFHYSHTHPHVCVYAGVYQLKLVVNCWFVITGAWCQEGELQINPQQKFQDQLLLRIVPACNQHRLPYNHMLGLGWKTLVAWWSHEQPMRAVMCKSECSFPDTQTSWMTRHFPFCGAGWEQKLTWRGVSTLNHSLVSSAQYSVALITGIHLCVTLILHIPYKYI